MQKYQKPIIVIIFLLVFATWFSYNVKSDFPLIFQKDLLAHDESSNSVVAANLTREIFPPMVRVNPLNETPGNWMEGPFWQHIPPLFAYVPYLFFKLDGQVTIEIKRLSFAFLTMLTGLLFIFSVYKYKKSLLAALAATVAAIFWINTPFTRELITGYAFGASDIVLAFTVVCAFAGVIWYLRGEKEERKEYPYWKLGSMAVLVALPIMAKSLLGAIPAATFFGFLIWDLFSTTLSQSPTVGEGGSISYSRRGITASDSSPGTGEVTRPTERRQSFGRGWGRFLYSAVVFICFLLLYFLPLYLASPVTFKNEVLVSFFHAQNYEGWSRPWYFYLTNYLPQRYLFGWTWAYYLGLVLATIYNVKLLISKREGRRIRITLAVSLLWFVGNLLAVSLVQSKIPNFIFQSYLLSLYFIVYSLLIIVKNLMEKFLKRTNVRSTEIRYRISVAGLIIAIFLMGQGYYDLAQAFRAERAQGYNYQTEHEKFYQLGEKLRSQGTDTRDLVIVNNPPNDCWERYYILFLTGAESKTLLEMYFAHDSSTEHSIEQKYRDVYFVDQNFEVKKITIQELNALLNLHQADIQQDILRIKKDKSSCQWLVPDAILNAE